MIIRTDSQAIVAFYKKISDHKPSRVRWLTFTDYITGTGLDIKFEHIDGKDNILADTLSRLVHLIMHEKRHPAEETLLQAAEEVTRAKNSNAVKRLDRMVTIIEQWQKKESVPEVHMLTSLEEPKFKCGCGKDADEVVSCTSRNPGRIFYKCKRGICYTWVWKDQIETYFSERIKWKMEVEEALEEIADDVFSNMNCSIEDAIDLNDVSNDDQWRRSP